MWNKCGKFRRKLRVNVNNFDPKMFMFVLFAAERTCVGIFEMLEQRPLGIALTSAPESTKNVSLVFGSKTNKRQERERLL